MIEAIVIRSVAWREHDRLVTLYSRTHGKLMAIAKGGLRATSKQSPALDPGTLIVCELVGGRAPVPIITGAQAVHCWGAIKAHAQSWAVAQFFLETVQTLVFDGQPDEALWASLCGSLRALEGRAAPLEVLRRGQCRLLEVFGYGAQALPTTARVRTDLDDQFERIAQRHFISLRLIYGMV